MEIRIDISLVFKLSVVLLLLKIGIGVARRRPLITCEKTKHKWKRMADNASCFDKFRISDQPPFISPRASSRL